MPYSSSALMRVASEIPGGRRGKMLLRYDPDRRERIVRRKGRQLCLPILGLVVDPLQIDLRKPGKLHRISGRSEGVAVIADDIHRDRVEDLFGHLGGNRPFPDKFVKPQLILGQVFLDRLRGSRERRGTDRLVGLLGALGLCPIEPRFGQGVRFPEEPDDNLPRLGQGRRGDLDAVGPHVGDQADHGIADFLALVELLGHVHRLFREKAELSGRLLLEGAGDKRGRRRSPDVFAPNLADPEHRPVQCIDDGQRRRLVGDIEFIVFLPVARRQGRGEGLVRALFGEYPLDRPEFPGSKSLYFPLPLADYPQRNRLYPSGRQAVSDLFPEQRGEVETHQVVEDDARLLGVNEVLGDSAGVGEGRLYGVLRYLGKDDPVHRYALRIPVVNPEDRWQDARRSPLPLGQGRLPGRPW